MIQSVKLLRVLYGHHVLYVFHDTDGCAVASGIRADRTDFLIAYIVADLAELHLTLHRGNSVGKLFHICLLLAQHVEYQAQSGLSPYARQFGELLYCPFQ